MTTFPDLYGWDTVYAISLPVLNRALATLPPSPGYSLEQPVPNGAARLDWSFGPWVVTDANGATIKISMVFGAGSVVALDVNGQVSQRPLDQPGWACTVTVKPVWIEGAPDHRHLVTDTGTGAGWAEVTVTPPDPNDASVFNFVISMQSMLQHWFDTAPEAVALFERELVVIDIGKDLSDTGQALEFLRPREFGFAGGTMADGVTKAVGLLAMTQEGKSPELGQLMLSPNAILANTDSALLISTELFFKHILLPSLAGVFSTDGIGDQSHFRLSGPRSEHLENSAALTFHMEIDGKTQTATLAPGQLSLTLDGDRLAMTTSGMEVTTAHEGFYGVIDMQESLAVRMIEKGDGSGDKIFFLTDMGAVEPKIDYRLSTGLEVAKDVIGALLALIGIALAVVSFRGPLMNRLNLNSQTARLVSRLIAAFVSTVGVAVALGPQILGWAVNGETHEIPDFSAVIDQSLGRVSLPGSSKSVFVATDARFANCLQVSVAPEFS